MRNDFRGLVFVLAVLAVLTTCHLPRARADCEIHGTVVSEPNTYDPSLGAWLYRLLVFWNTGSQYAMSHIDLLMDVENGHCDCTDLMQAIVWGDHIGSGLGDPLPCLLFYQGEILCNGDPSISAPGIMLKFEPLESEQCQPGPAGTATITFYSDFAPGTIAEPNLFLMDKYAGFVCQGPITGDFPSVPCNPVSAEATSWGLIKQLYNRRP
jgi:hypothetical protein